MGELMMLGSTAFLAPILGVLPMLGTVIYVVARWRSYRDGLPPDPQLGFKTAMHFFMVLGFQLLLLGAFLLVWGIFKKGPSGEAMRTAAALVVAGGIVFGAHMVGLTRTNDQSFPLVGRMFAGLCLIITGLIATMGLTMALIALFSKGDSGDVGRGAWSATIVYGIAWAVQGLRFNARTFGGAPPGAQQFVAPPPAVPPPGQARPY
jgi:hypothetical protein